MAPAAAVEGAVKDIAVTEINTEGGAMKAAVEGEYLYRSKLPDIDIPDNLPVHEYCFQHIDKFANNPCLIDGATERVWTYAEVELNSRKVAAGLTASGVKSGDVVMLLVQNCAEFAFTFLGASMIGAIVTTANPFYTPGEIAKQAAGSNAKIVVTHAAFAVKLQGLDNISAIYTIDGPVPEGCKAFLELLDADEEKDFPKGIKVDPNGVVALPYSSGTTGLPKGVKLSHRGLVASVAQLADGENPNLYFNSEDVLLCVLPLFHIYCLHTVLLCAIRVGAAMVLMPKFNITSMLQYIEKYKISILPIVPPVVVEITKCDQIVAEKVSSVRMIICGGAPLAKEIEAELRKRFPRVVFGQGYGMTEAGPVLAMNLAFAKHPFPVKSGSCGTVVRNAQVKIIDTETGVSLPHNKAGEICIRGPEIMIGYLNDDEATEETIDKEGWLHTGDVGYIDDNEELFIVDRVKEIIKYKGFQVAPAEIEALLMQHPSISKAAVVPEKHEVAGEVPVAFVVRSDGNEISEQEIKAYLEKKVIFYKRIHRVIFTDNIPIAPSGKILRKDLKARLQQAASA